MAHWSNSLTIPVWMLSVLIALMSWGVLLEVRVGRMEDRLAASTEQIAVLEGDHDRLVTIEANVEAALRLQAETIRLLDRRDDTR